MATSQGLRILTASRPQGNPTCFVCFLQGDLHFWRGDFRFARPLYKSAELEAAHSTDLFSLPHRKGVVVLFGLAQFFGFFC